MTTSELRQMADAMVLINSLARRGEVNSLAAANAVCAIGDLLTKSGGYVVDDARQPEQVEA